jgi:uncharacterized ParB-like nuclease family protein
MCELKKRLREDALRTKALTTDAIRIDGNTQSRAGIDEETVSAYVETWEATPAAFPPIDVFHDGTDYWLADGFHRLLSAKRAGIKSIKAAIHQGTSRDAFLFAAKCNATHGKRRTNADKRFVVARLLNDQEWCKRSDRWIAEAAAVSHKFVASVRSQVSLATVASDEPREGRDGRKQKPASKKRGKAKYRDMLAKMEQEVEPKPAKVKSDDREARDLLSKLAACLRRMGLQEQCRDSIEGIRQAIRECN